MCELQEESSNGCTPRSKTLDGDVLHNAIPFHDTHVEGTTKNVTLPGTAIFHFQTLGLTSKGV